MKSPRRLKTRKYRQLLLALIVIFLTFPFLTVGIGNVLAALLLLYTTIVILKSLALPKLLFSASTAIATLAFVLELDQSVGWLS